MSGKFVGPMITRNRPFGCSISLLKSYRRQLTTNESNKNETKSSGDEKLAVKKDESTKQPAQTKQSTFVQIKQIPVKFDKYVRKMQGEEDDEDRLKTTLKRKTETRRQLCFTRSILTRIQERKIEKISW